MALTTHTRRALTGLAAGGLITLATTLPAVATPDPGAPPPAVSIPEPGTPPPGSVIDSGSTVREVTVETPVDDDAVELLQVGLGALGGMALVGAGAVAFTVRRQHAGTRSHQAPHPA
jgi:hypothetical protein